MGYVTCRNLLWDSKLFFF